MNNLNSISDYQKIIFVKGLNEHSNELGEAGIQGLSSKYNFAVFVTSFPNEPAYDNEGKPTDNGTGISGIYPVTNLWFDGIRLTRFIGIDNKHNIINVNDHKLKLDFNYETGLIGIYDVNKLDNIKIVQCTYKGLDNRDFKIYDESGHIFETGLIINSLDNRFTLRFKYEVGEDTDISEIPKALSYNYTNYLLKTTESIVEEDQSLYDITYWVNQSTLDIFEDLIKVIFRSKYSNEISTKEIPMVLYLNPTYYDVIIDNMIIAQTAYLDKDSDHIIILSFSPNNIISDSNHYIYAKIVDYDPNIITVINDECGLIKSNVSSICQFTIRTTGEVPTNGFLNTRLTFEVYCNENEHTYTYPLTKTINIYLEGDKSDKYFYYGYKNIPNLNNFSIDNLIGDTNLIDHLFNDYIDENLNANDFYFYNTDDRNREEYNINYNSNDHFYCIIPNNYKDIVKPRWNAQITNDRGITYEYLSCTEWFKSYTCTINDTEFIIYIREEGGKFYGKLK